jgi:RHS repeat-associated protein
MKKIIFIVLFLFIGKFISFSQTPKGVVGIEDGCYATAMYNGIDVRLNPIILDATAQTIRITFEFETPCFLIMRIQNLPSWITISSQSYASVDLLIQGNLVSAIRQVALEFEGFKVKAKVAQGGPGCAGVAYYPDTDGDGFGGYFSSPEISCNPVANKVANHLDFCPNEYSLINNGCIPPPENLNWVLSESYDIKDNLLASSKAYFDNLGKSTQTQTLDIKEQRIWATQTLYDKQGRAAFQTLSSPVTEKGKGEFFKFKNGFIKKENGTNFTETDFTTGNIENPATIGSTENTLGWYYSDENNDEEFQDKTLRPYSRTIFSTLNPGAVKQTIGGSKIGEDVDGNGGEWKQGYSFSMPAAQEMYYVFGYDYFQAKPDIKTTYEGIQTTLDDGNKQITWLKATKSVVEDIRGNEAVVFTDTDGKTLAAARAGIPENPADEKQYEVLSLIGAQKYIDIHIPKGCDDMASFVGAVRSDFIIYNLKTEELVSDANLKAGFYRIEYTGATELTKNHTLTYINKTTGNIEPVETEDAVGVRYMVNYYDFSINYYNTVGNLTASLQPIGFNKSCLDGFIPIVTHNNNAESTFSYNSLGQLLSTKSPDEGTANFKYRKDGQIRFSQNSKQQESLLEEYSYTNYDEFGRPEESGVVVGTFSGLNGDTSPANGNDEQHYTEYDFLSAANNTILQTNAHSNYHSPSFLAGNVATTWNTDSNGNNISQTFYSYDLYGRVQWIVQNIPGLGVKTIDYEYDPITSQVLKVIYQKHDLAELFVHQYTYNIAQELEKVQTQAGNNALVTHADYTYYETGALKRTEIAEGIQGIDYVYNLAGQLKAINHPDLNTESQRPSSEQAGEDLFGMTLDYYSGDYKRNSNFSLPISGTDQYNGNIKGMTWNTNTDNVVTPPFQYSYEYNKSNWLTQANFYANGNTQSTAADLVLNSVITSPTDAKAINSITLAAGFNATNNFTAKIVAPSTTNGEFGPEDYKVHGITYDANGNILQLNRNKNTEDINGTTSNKMDELTYKYYDKTDLGEKHPNRLKRVEDAFKKPTNANDIKDQTTTNNYEYNSIGQLTKNNDEGVGYEYNASGLVTKVFYNTFVKVQFFYNDKGYRTKKVTNKDNSNTVIDKTTHYVLDAAGSTLAIYENNTLQELPIYGASRLGIYKKPSSTSVYQLTDHLGNVRAVIAKQGTSAVALVSATDYYPFGMPMPGRRIVGGYRYQYQGQEVDPETGKEAFQLRLWDGRIGRWLTTDPAGQYDSPYMGMGNNPISRYDPDGGCDQPDNSCGWFKQLFYSKESISQWKTWQSDFSSIPKDIQIRMATESLETGEFVRSLREMGIEASVTSDQREAANSNINFLVGLALPSGKLATTGKVANQTLKAKTVTPQLGSTFNHIVSEGKVFFTKGSNGNIVDFVITKSNEVLLGSGHFHLSNAANKIKSAGQLNINSKGVITSISNWSGHYQPNFVQLQNSKTYLGQLGYDVSKAILNYAPF